MTSVEFGRIPNVPICETGHWPASTGWVDFTTDDFAAAVQAVADCPAVRNPALILGHTDDEGQNPHGLPAVGWASDLRTTNDGHTLMCDYEGMPAWLAEAAPSAYPDRSVEGAWDFTCSLGHTHDFVITAVALLGTEMPAVGPLTSLQDIASLYGVAASLSPDAGPRRFQTTPKATTMPQPVKAVTSATDIAREFYENAPWDQWIREIDVDPAQIIVESDEGLLRIPYTISGDVIEFADPIPVVTEYRDLPAEATAKAAARVAAGFAALGPRTVRAAYGTREQTRPTTSSASAAEPATAGGTTKEMEVGMPDTLIEGLRKQLGLAADADEATVLAANEEALKERAEPAVTPAPAEPVGEPVTVAASTAPAGTVLVDQAQWAETVKAAKAGQQALDRLDGERRSDLVQAAIKDGRIAPSQREHWTSKLAAEGENGEKVLAALAPGLVPISEIGNAEADDPGTNADAIRETPAYKNWSSS